MTHPTVPCPHCGEEIRADASFCRHCGSSDEDGWGDDQGEFDAGQDDFDYDEFVEEEFSTRLAGTQTRPLWRFVAVVLLILFAGSSLLWLL